MCIRMARKKSDPNKPDKDENFVPSKKVAALVDMIFGEAQKYVPAQRKVPDAVLRSQEATKREMFCEAVMQGLSMSAACKFSCVSPKWVEKQCDEHPDFKDAISRAYSSGTDYLEDLAFVRAHYSDAILIKLLEARRPEKFRAKIGSGGPQVIVNVSPLYPEAVKILPIKEIDHVEKDQE